MFLINQDQENHEIYRVKLTLSLILITIALFLMSEFLLTEFDYIEVALLITASMMCLLYFWLNVDTVQVVSGLILWSSSTLVFFLAWRHGGVFDSAIFAYPCIILLAINTGAKILYLPVIISVFVQIILLMVFHEIHLIETPLPGSITSQHRGIDLGIITLLFCTITYFFVGTFKQRLSQLNQEKNSLSNELNKSQMLLKYDPLSKLPNEHVCYETLQPFLVNVADGHTNMSFMVLDIINLRQINNSFGHDIGDTLIIEIANRLTIMLQENEYLYRFNGNEFVLVKLSLDPKEFEVFKERILQAVITDFAIGEYKISALCSIGIALAPFDGDTIDVLKSNAHLALQYSKAQQKNSAQYFKPYIKEMVEDKSFYITAIKNAIKNNELYIHYQPKFDLQNNTVVGAEALIRWEHPERGLIPPNIFIPMAEESGIIVDITKFVIEKSCQDCMYWQSLGYSNISVAINLSAVDFRKGNLPQLIFTALANTGLSPHLLELEITESTIFDDLSHIQTQIRKIQQKGISFAIDDFGTGYSNLGYLNKFNVSVLKIDQSFIKKVATSEHEQHIVKAIIRMSNSLGIHNVAEGIEDKATAEWLYKAGCKIGQGYFWEKPLPLEAFVECLKKEKLQE